MEEKFEKLNDVISYIENHLDEDITMESLAKIASSSEFDFQRLFSFLCNISPSTYIRRRRMSQAVADLKKGNKVIDVAIKYGYQNPISFSRAFKEMFGILPSETKNSSFDFNVFPKLELSIIIKEDYKMKFRIVRTTQPCNFLGVEKVFSHNKLNQIPKFWEKLQKDKEYDLMSQVSTGFPYEKDYYDKCDIDICGVHSISFNELSGKQKYVIGAFTDNNAVSKYRNYIIPSAEFLVVSGDLNFEKLWQDIMQWFSSSIYKRDSKPTMEIYGTTSDGKDYAEIWIPIVRQAFDIKSPSEIKSKNKDLQYLLLPELKFVGKTLLCNKSSKQNISEFWTSFNGEQKNNQLLSLPKIFTEYNTFSGITITTNFCKEKEGYKYCVGVFTTKDAIVPKGYDVYSFKPTMAVYSNLGIPFEELRQKIARNGLCISQEDMWGGELYSCDEPLMNNGEEIFHWLFPVKNIAQ